MRTSRKTPSIGGSSLSASSASSARRRRGHAGDHAAAPRACARGPRAPGARRPPPESSRSRRPPPLARGRARGRFEHASRMLSRHPRAELRQRHHDLRARPGADLEPVALAERGPQPALHVVQADPAAVARPAPRAAVSGSIPAPSSRTRQLHVGARRCAPRSRSSRPSGRDSTPWRTAFSTSGCTRQHRDDRGEDVRVDLDAHAHAVAEARLLEPQVLLHVAQLVGQRDVRALAARTRSG